MLTGDRTIHRACPCGWEGWYTTNGYADKAQRNHSCDTDWTPQTCRQTKAHDHGTAAHHKHCGCRCWPCREAILDQEEASAKARAYGRTRLVSGEDALNHVLQLMHAGMGTPRIAELSGIHRDTIERLVRRKWTSRGWETSHRIARATEAALLAVTYDPANGGPVIDGDSTARRLRALVALGWWPSLIARTTGYEQAYIDRLIRGRKVRPGTARRIHALYRQLVDQPAPTGTYADRARKQARERGWMPPLRVGGRVVVGSPLEDPSRRTGPRRAA